MIVLFVIWQVDEEVEPEKVMGELTRCCLALKLVREHGNNFLLVGVSLISENSFPLELLVETTR